MNVERKIIQNKTCVQNKRKHREKEIRTKTNKQKKSSSDFLYFNFSSFIKKKQKPKISSFTNHTSTNNHQISI